MRAFFSRWVVGVVVAFLLMCPHLRMYSVERTRYFAYWGRGDALALAFVVLALGTLFYLIHRLAHTCKYLFVGRAADAIFVMILGAAAVANLGSADIGGVRSWSSVGGGVLMCLIVTVAIIGLAARWNWFVRACRMSCLVIAPAGPLILLQLLSHPQYSVHEESLPGPGRTIARVDLAATEAPADIYMLIFDACSYQRTIGSPDLEKNLPNLAALAAHATVYHDAHSPYEETRRSLPGILFQTNDEYMPLDGQLGFMTADQKFETTSARPSIFSRYKNLGYMTYMVGWDHPYRRMLGPEVDFCYSAAFKEGNGNDLDFVQSVKRHLWLGFAKCAVAIPKPAGLRWRVTGFCGLTDFVPVAIERLAAIHDLAIRVVRNQTAPTFAVFHYSIPHAPMIFTHDGVDLDVVKKYPLEHSDTDEMGFARPDPANRIARYTGNLRYMDRLLGELIDILKSTGRYDDATIIITSDHTWRVDPRLDHLYVKEGVGFGNLDLFAKVPRDFTHVPLVVKHARQRESTQIHEPFELSGLFDAIQHPRKPQAPTMPEVAIAAPATARPSGRIPQDNSPNDR